MVFIAGEHCDGGWGKLRVWQSLRSRSGLGMHRIPEGVRVYAIGDVHGRADLLVQMFAAIDADLANQPPQLAVHVFLGDYIDRGPASCQVIDLVIDRSRAHHVVPLRGNHEAYLTQFLGNPSVLSGWLQIGGLETLMSYGLKPSVSAEGDEQRELAERFAAVLPASHLHLFRQLRTSFSYGDFYFVHAGVRPGVSLERQSEEDMLWIREEFLFHEKDFGKMVVHGHTPVRNLDCRENRINIDTGAYATGKLTCLIIEHDELAFLSTVA